MQTININIAITLVIFFSSLVTVAQPHIQIDLINRSLTNGGMTFTFDIQATALPGYTGNDNMWQGMSVSYDIALTGTQAISSATGVVNPANANTVALPTSFPGGCTTCKFRLNMTRTTQPDLIIGFPVILGTGTVNFNEPVSGSTIVTPRTGTTASGSFWANATAGSRPFGLQPAFALPITLSHFSANKLGERSTKLDWRTSSEINSSHFEIQRSVDGIEWAHLGDVAAAGNSTSTRSYDFIDDKLPLGRSKNQIFYYRLRMVDQDGAFKYSDIRGVNFNINDRGDVSIYPNPAAQFFNLDLTGIDFSIDEKATVFIYDMSGKLVRQKDIIGSGIEPINVSELPAEAYNVIIRHGDQQYSKRVIVTK